MFKQPIMAFVASKDKIKTIYERTLKRELSFSIYTEELFTTYNDEDNHIMGSHRKYVHPLKY